MRLTKQAGIFSVIISWGCLLPLVAQSPSLKVGGIVQEMRTFFGVSDGLPSDDVKQVRVA